MSLLFPSKCVACKKEKWFTRIRTYTVPKELLKKNPNMAPLNGMSSDGELCPSCFNKLKKIAGM